jgi:hypothetical protein
MGGRAWALTKASTKRTLFGWRRRPQHLDLARACYAAADKLLRQKPRFSMQTSLSRAGARVPCNSTARTHQRAK